MRAATIRGLSRSPTAGVFSEVNEAFTPRSLPDFAAWFDALDTRTMLSGDGSTITDGGAVALWGDKSGNSGANCLVTTGTSGDRVVLTVGGSAIGTGDFTFEAKFRAPRANPASIRGIAYFGSSNTTAFAANTGTLQVETDGRLSFRTIDASTANNRYAYLDTNLVSAYGGQIVTASIVRNSSGLTFYINGVSLAYTNAVGGGTPSTFPNWDSQGTYLRIASYVSTLEADFPIYQVRLYNAALTSGQVNTAYATGLLANVDFTAQARLATSFTASTGQTVTLTSNGATGLRIAGERDLFQGTLANRPIFLQYAGTKYGYLNATAGNYFSTPDSAAVSITGDREIVMRINIADYTPAALQEICAKWDTSRSFILRLNTTGTLQYIYSTDGTAGVNCTSTANLSATPDNTTLWIKVTHDVDNGAVGNDVAFYYQADTGNNTVPSAGWTQLGATVTTAGVVSIFDGTAALQISQRSATDSPLAGRVYYWHMSNAIGGAAVTVFNPALYTSGTTLTASTGEVWTINGGAHIVTRTGLYCDGSNDYLKTAAFSLSQPETVYLAGQQVTWVDADNIIDGAVANTMRIYQRTTTPSVQLFAGSAAAANTGWTLKTAAAVVAIFNGASSLLRINRGTATTGDAGNAASANGLTIGAYGDGGSLWGNVFVSEVALYSAAHGTATQDRMALAMGRKHGFSV